MFLSQQSNVEQCIDKENNNEKRYVPYEKMKSLIKLLIKCFKRVPLFVIQDYVLNFTLMNLLVY